MASKQDYAKFNEYLNSIPLEELRKRNDEELEKNTRDFEEFKEALLKGVCSFCGNPLTHFSQRKPCFHWLLKPKGFKTKHFPLLYQQKSYHQINAYLRWVANTESPLKSINDLVEERSSSKVIEETIKYKQFEWSFSCSKGDFEGHGNSNEGRAPHYHFQMRINGNVVIRYGQFHIPFTEYDDFCFAVARGEFDRIKAGQVEGAGMQSLYESLSPEELLDMMVAASPGKEKEAQFNTQTLISADEGTTISGEDLADIFEEHERTKVPIAKLVRRLKNITATSYITPGQGVPQIASRKPNRSKKKKGESHDST